MNAHSYRDTVQCTIADAYEQEIHSVKKQTTAQFYLQYEVLAKTRDHGQKIPCKAWHKTMAEVPGSNLASPGNDPDALLDYCVNNVDISG